MPTDPDPAHQFVAKPELRPLWQALHARLATGNPVRSVQLDLGDPATGEALANLLGWPRRPSAGPVRVRLADLERVLAEAGLPAPAQLVAELVGPVADRRAQRQAAAAERAALWEWLAGHPTVGRLGLSGWAEQVRVSGVIESVSRTREILTSALAVLAELPADSEPLAVLAGRVLADPHALDDGQRVAALVQRAAATQLEVEPPTSAAGRRDLWERVGVRTDELSSTVLLAGAWHPGTGVVAEMLSVGRRHGQVVCLTLAQVRSCAPPDPVGQVVHVVENPTVLAAAVARFPDRCPALACVSGWPSAAALRLLSALAERGARLAYHGDFDADGLRIADYLVTHVGAQPWRLTEAEYRAAAETTTPPGRSVAANRLPELRWDPGLRAALAEIGVPVYEEQVIDSLLADLAHLANRPN